MERDRCPHLLRVRVVYTVTFQEVVCGIRTVHLETKRASVVLPGEAKIMKYRGGVEQLGIGRETLVFRGQRGPGIDSYRVLRKKIAARVAQQLRRLAGDLAVGDAYPRHSHGIDALCHVGAYSVGVVRCVSFVSTMKTASSFAGAVLLALRLMRCFAPGSSKKDCPAA